MMENRPGERMESKMKWRGGEGRGMEGYEGSSDKIDEITKRQLIVIFN